MEANNFDPNDPRVQIIIANHQLKFIEKINDLQGQLELKKQEVKFLNEAFRRNERSISRRNRTAKLQAFLFSIVFLLSTILVGFGINMLTSIPSNPDGWLLIGLGIAAYIVATISTLLITEGSSE